MYVYATSEEESKIVCKNILEELNMYIAKIKIMYNIPYWKIEGIYEMSIQIEALIDLIKEDKWIEFLNNITDKWVEYGDPVNEILISRNLEGCNFIRDDVEMINMFLNENE